MTATNATSIVPDFNKYKTLVFDCDGVILDSNKIKTEAFYEIALPYGEEIAQQLVAYHKQHGGVSRFHKLEYFFSKILHHADFQSELEANIALYGKLVKDKLLTCELIAGFSDFIQQPSIRHKRKIVLSGGFQDELWEVFEHRKLSDYFQGLFGSPDTKYEILDREIKKNTIMLPAMYFGDSKLDYEIATAFRMDFIFLSTQTEFSEWQQYFKGLNVRIIKDWTDLNSALQTWKLI